MPRLAAPTPTRAMTPGFLERAYDTAPAAPDNARRFARWQREAAGVMARHPPRTISYGRGERRAIDLFLPAGGGSPPVLLFLHGGYWQRRSRQEFAWLVPFWLRRGVAVAMVGYPLCPDVSFARLVEDVRNAVVALWRQAPRLGLSRRWIVSGHSAGGHLAAVLAATDWPRREAAMPAAPFAGCVAVSGVFELAPLLATPLNDALRLDRHSAAVLSAGAMAPPPRLPAILAVGGAESGEFHRQTDEMAARWQALGAEAVALTLPHCNHFTALEALSREGSPLAAATLGLIAAADRGAEPLRPRRRPRTR